MPRDYPESPTVAAGVVAMLDTLAADVRVMAGEIRALRAEVAAVRMAPQPEWLTVSEAARHFGVSVSTINRRVDSGTLEARGSGKLRRVRV